MDILSEINFMMMTTMCTICRPMPTSHTCMSALEMSHEEAIGLQIYGYFTLLCLPLLLLQADSLHCIPSWRMTAVDYISSPSNDTDYADLVTLTSKLWLRRCTHFDLSFEFISNACCFDRSRRLAFSIQPGTSPI